MGINWNQIFSIVLNIGGFAGLFSFIYIIIKDFRKVLSKPKIIIHSIDKEKDLKIWTINGQTRKVANLHVYSKGQKSSERCVAKLEILKKPSEVKHLDRSYILHWADIDYSFRTTEAQPINLGFYDRRLDLVFTQKNINNEGSWIAIPLALMDPLRANQAYLPPGKYIFRITIFSDNGKKCIKKYKIKSPHKWDDLDINGVK